MSATPSTVRRIGVGLVLAGAALVSAACAAGQHAATSVEQSTQDGVNGDIGKIALRSISIAAPSGAPSYSQGADVVLNGVIVNNSGATDTLTGIKTSAASGYAIFASSGDAAAVIAADQAGTSSSATSTQAGSPTVDVLAGQRASFGTPTSTGAILLTGLAKELFPAQTVAITFTFKTAGSVTLQVPVQITGAA